MTEATAPVRGARLSRSARRAQLLEAARDVFAEQGYHAAAMDDIAERAGVSKPVLYQHFPGKLELYRALLTTHAEDLVSRVRTALTGTTDNQERIRAAVSAYFTFVDEEGSSYRLVFGPDLRGEPEAAAVVEDLSARCVALVADAVTTDAGLDPERARLLGVALVGLSEVTAQAWLDQRMSLPRAEAVELVAALAWRGMAGFPLMGADAPES
jgi:AcrR family transcriptional regulator